MLYFSFTNEELPLCKMQETAQIEGSYEYKKRKVILLSLML